MLGTGKSIEEIEDHQGYLKMGPVDVDHNNKEPLGGGGSGHAGFNEEALLGKICSEELIKVTGNQPNHDYPRDMINLGYHGSQAVHYQQSLPVPQPTGQLQLSQKLHQQPKPKDANCPYDSVCTISKECRSLSGRCGLLPTRLAESYYGYVETVDDAVMIVEACRFGRLMRVKRRLLEKERQGIRSGSVFVFVERESGIRRWTDGKVWSPSRICGEFLIYRELENRQPPVNRRSQTPTQVNWTEQVAKILAAKAKPVTTVSSENGVSISTMVPEPTPAQTANAIANIRMALATAVSTGPTTDSLDESDQSSPGINSVPKSMNFKKDGLIKKTISLTVSDETYHLICYFKDSNLQSELLHLTPNRMAAFKNLDICRNPVSYPIMMLQPGHGQTSGTTNPIPPQYYTRITNAGQGASGPYISISNGGYIHQQPQQQPQHYMHAYQQQQQPLFQTRRRLVPNQPPQPTSIANGSVHLPPVNIPSSSPRPNIAGLANLLNEPGSPMVSSTADLESLSGSCPSSCTSCPSGGSCASRSRKDKENFASKNNVAVTEDCSLEEEQILFCHFLDAVRNEQH